MAINEKMHPDAIKRRIEESAKSINTMFVGTIVSVDHVNMNYNVQPILTEFDEIDGSDIVKAILFECPMMLSKSGEFFIRIPYSIGDVVYVGVCKESADESLTSSEPHRNKNNGTTNFRMVDGVILGGLMTLEEQRMPSSNLNDLLIQNRRTGDKMVLVSGGGIELNSPSLVKVITPKLEILSPETTMSGNLTVTGNITGKANLNITGAGQIGSVTTKAGVTLDGHTHTYNPGPGSPTPTGTGKG